MSGEDELDEGRTNPTPEVGDEGGSPGDVLIREIDRGTGSEATETWRPKVEKEVVIRDETGEGRKSP